jgi:hypothetical protein
MSFRGQGMIGPRPRARMRAGSRMTPTTNGSVRSSGVRSPEHSAVLRRRNEVPSGDKFPGKGI